MNNHGSFAKVGDLVRLLSPQGIPTDYVGVVSAEKFNKSLLRTDSQRFLSVVCQKGDLRGEWIRDSYLMILVKGEK